MRDNTCLIKFYALFLSRYIIAKNIMIGRNLKILREANGFTQQQMASFLGVNRSTYANYEVSARETPLDILEKAADILGADLSVFFEEDENAVRSMLVCAFRADNLSVADMKEVAAFKNLVKSYLKINYLLEK